MIPHLLPHHSVCAVHIVGTGVVVSGSEQVRQPLEGPGSVVHLDQAAHAAPRHHNPVHQLDAAGVTEN